MVWVGPASGSYQSMAASSDCFSLDSTLCRYGQNNSSLSGLQVLNSPKRYRAVLSVSPLILQIPTMFVDFKCGTVCFQGTL